MKLINLYKGLMDQMPLSRFIRNLRTGNVLGLFYKRSHFREDGTSKVGYKTKETAIKVAGKMSEKKGVHFSNYKCIFCDDYHLGRNRDNKDKNHQIPSNDMLEGIEYQREQLLKHYDEKKKKIEKKRDFIDGYDDMLIGMEIVKNKILPPDGKNNEKNRDNK